MAKNEKIWSILVHLSMHMWSGALKTPFKENFDEDFWDYIVEESAKSGINMIVLDIGDGIEFGSHPEIADEGAWTRRRVRQEVKRCKELGIELVPKLNFSTCHGYWMGEYRKMTSTTAYYQMQNDLIKEVYKLFDKPRYIHLGMDEEDARHCGKYPYAVYRQGELFAHDLRFMIDCVADTGAKPWIWGDLLLKYTEEYTKNFDAEDAILSPWYYNAFRREHWTPVESRAEYVAYYNEGDYAKLGIKWVEEDPYLVNFREIMPKLVKEGYEYIPCASVFNRCDWNHEDLVEYFKEGTPDEQIAGFMTAPWFSTKWKNKEYFDESFKFFKKAKEKYYAD